MKSSEKLDQLLPALAKARVKFGEIKKTQVNLHFGKKYADLSDILPEIVGPLAAEGLVLLGTMEALTSGEVEVTQRLMHVSEQYLESMTILSYPPGQLQKLGGDVSYFRRYSINTMLALSADEDLDDARPEEPTRPARKPTPRQAEPTPTPAAMTGTAKPTKEEVTKLLHRMQEVYGDATVVTGLIRAMVQPAGEVWTDFRVRNNLTGAAWQQLMADTERDATPHAGTVNGNHPDDDVPLTPGPESPSEPVAETSPQREPRERGEPSEALVEAASVGGGPSETIPPMLIDAPDVPEVAVGDDGMVRAEGMDLLQARANKFGKVALIGKILGRAAGLTLGQFRYAWVEVGPKQSQVPA